MYHKKQLFLLINQYKKYSDEEIYIALDILINNKNEFLKDMLDRPGKLVNIGEYYMFQPMEIYNKSIPLFQRKTPIEYENNKIQLSIPKMVYKKKGNDNSMLDNIIENYYYLIGQNKILNTPNRLKVKKYREVILEITKHNGIKHDILAMYTIHHMIEELPYLSKKRILLNYETIEDKNMKHVFDVYFDKYEIGKVDGKKAIALPNEKNSIRKYNFFVKQNIASNKTMWIEENKRLTILIKKLIETFKVVQWKDKWLLKDGKEKTVHFYDTFRERIVSKIKELGEKSNSSGKQCSVGQSKKVISKKLKELDQNIQKKLNKKGDSLKMSSLKKMCIAITLYSYYLTYTHNEKYNYSLLEGFLYDVYLLPKIDSNKQDKDGNTLFLM